MKDFLLLLFSHASVAWLRWCTWVSRNKVCTTIDLHGVMWLVWLSASIGSVVLETTVDCVDVLISLIISGKASLFVRWNDWLLVLPFEGYAQGGGENMYVHVHVPAFALNLLSTETRFSPVDYSSIKPERDMMVITDSKEIPPSFPFCHGTRVISDRPSGGVWNSTSDPWISGCKLSVCSIMDILLCSRAGSNGPFLLTDRYMAILSGFAFFLVRMDKSFQTLIGPQHRHSPHKSTRHPIVAMIVMSHVLHLVNISNTPETSGTLLVCVMSWLLLLMASIKEVCPEVCITADNSPIRSTTFRSWLSWKFTAPSEARTSAVISRTAARWLCDRWTVSVVATQSFCSLLNS